MGDRSSPLPRTVTPAVYTVPVWPSRSSSPGNSAEPGRPIFVVFTGLGRAPVQVDDGRDDNVPVSGRWAGRRRRQRRQEWIDRRAVGGPGRVHARVVVDGVRVPRDVVGEVFAGQLGPANLPVDVPLVQPGHVVVQSLSLPDAVLKGRKMEGSDEVLGRMADVL